MRLLHSVIALTAAGVLISSAQLALTQDLVSSSASTAARQSTLARPRPAILPSDVAELEIALGRLRLMPTRFRILRRHESLAEVEGQRSVQVSVVDRHPTLRLTYADRAEKWSLQADAIIGVQWSREFTAPSSQPGGMAVKIDYSQKPHQPIALLISGTASKPVRLTGPTLWHLTEQGSQEVAKYVLPSLERLNSTWDLPEILAAAKKVQQSCGLAVDQSLESEIEQCMKDLESEEYSVRAIAAERIRQAGIIAQIPLERLSHKPLTAQQRSTIDKLLAGLEPRSADTPTRLAYWLSGDRDWR